MNEVNRRIGERRKNFIAAAHVLTAIAVRRAFDDGMARAYLDSRELTELAPKVMGRRYDERQRIRR